MNSIYSPSLINSMLGKKEQVLFVGEYNITTKLVKGNIGTLPYKISIDKKATGICTFDFSYVNTIKTPNVKYANETYYTSSYNTLGKKIGQIVWTGLYIDSPTQAGVTTGGIFTFIVIGKDGIYKKVKRVIMDFTNQIRKIYFIGKKI